jgi:THO complex subunit 2
LNNAPIAPPEDRLLPFRPDLGRHRGVQNSDDGLGKRRRPPDDDVS